MHRRTIVTLSALCLVLTLGVPAHGIELRGTELVAFPPADHLVFKTVGFDPIPSLPGSDDRGQGAGSPERYQLLVSFWYGTFTNPAAPGDPLDETNACAASESCVVVDLSGTPIPRDRLYLIPAEAQVEVELVEFSLNGLWPENSSGAKRIPPVQDFDADGRYERGEVRVVRTDERGRVDFATRDALYSLRAPALKAGLKKGPDGSEVRTVMVVATFEVREIRKGGARKLALGPEDPSKEEPQLVNPLAAPLAGQADGAGGKGPQGQE